MKSVRCRSRRMRDVAPPSTVNTCQGSPRPLGTPGRGGEKRGTSREEEAARHGDQYRDHGRQGPRIGCPRDRKIVRPAALVPAEMVGCDQGRPERGGLFQPAGDDLRSRYRGSGRHQGDARQQVVRGQPDAVPAPGRTGHPDRGSRPGAGATLAPPPGQGVGTPPPSRGIPRETSRIHTTTGGHRGYGFSH